MAEGLRLTFEALVSSHASHTRVAASSADSVPRLVVGASENQDGGQSAADVDLDPFPANRREPGQNRQ